MTMRELIAAFEKEIGVGRDLEIFYACGTKYLMPVETIRLIRAGDE